MGALFNCVLDCVDTLGSGNMEAGAPESSCHVHTPRVGTLTYMHPAVSDPTCLVGIYVQTK
jgi:hypothetical protein